MSTGTYEQTQGHDGATGAEGEHAAWLERTRVVLSPVAAPSILGLYAFAGATFMVSAHLAGWFGTPRSPVYLFPFAALFGGVAQFLAAIWSYRARDGLATAMHGMWGSFWMAYGVLFLLVATGTIAVPATGSFTELGYWFLPLAAITAVGFVAALAESLGLALVLGALAAGSALAAIFYLTGTTGWGHTAGWVLQVSSWLAFYTASAMMLEGTWGRTILPLGKAKRDADIPGRRFSRPLEYERGTPGVRQGQ